jgi:hypothetical protein
MPRGFGVILARRLLASFAAFIIVLHIRLRARKMQIHIKDSTARGRNVKWLRHALPQCGRTTDLRGAAHVCEANSNRQAGNHGLPLRHFIPGVDAIDALTPS